MEAKKTKGRFIRRHDSLSKVVKITDFSFEEIAKLKPTHPDNSRANVIYRRLHSEESFNSGIKSASDIIKVMDPPDKPPIIMPTDFTEDWNRLKNRYANRRGKADEEEEFEMELEYLKSKKQSNNPKEPTTNDEQQADRHSTEDMDQTKDHTKQQSTSTDIEKEIELENSQSNFKINRNASQSLNAIQNDIPLKEESIHGGMEKMAAAVERNINEEEQYVDEHIDAAHLSDEIDNHSNKNQEFRSFSTYLHNPTVKTITEDETKMIEEAKAKGYEDGFKLGEEKATLQVKNTIKQLGSTISDAIDEIQNLKKNVLINAESNFLVLAQALIESILRRQLHIDPTTFHALIKRAIEDAVPDDDFKILVSQHDNDLLKQVVDEKIKNKIIIDNSIEPGDFRIDSRLTVIDAKISEIVADLLQQADLNLFEAPKNERLKNAS